MFPLGSNPGHKVTKNKVQPLDDMGRSIFSLVVSSFKVGRDDSLVTCNMPLYAAVTKGTILKTGPCHAFLEIDPNSESTCIRN